MSELSEYTMPFETVDKHRPSGRHNGLLPAMQAALAALVAFVLGMSLTLWLEHGDREQAEREQERMFAEAATEVTNAIREQLENSEKLIRTFQSVFLASREVTPEEFARVYDNLRIDRSHVNLQAIAYAERRLGEGHERFITTMYAPTRGNEAIRGLDVTEQPNNLRAILETRDSDNVSMSAPFTLRQSAGSTAVDGFILRLPVFSGGPVPTTIAARRQRLIGSIGASFRISDLIAGVMPRDSALISGVRVEDVTSGQERVLYDYRFGTSNSRHILTENIQFGGRVWAVTTQGSEGPAVLAGWSDIFWLGSVASVLLAALSWSLVSTRERALKWGGAISDRYRASEERFRKLTELLPSLVLVARRDGGAMVYQNAAARARLGAMPEQSTLADIFQDDASLILFGDMDSRNRAADVQMRSPASEPFWASVCTSAIDISGEAMWLIVASDVSEQRRLTERLSYQASHDSLTKLINRREFEARVSNALASPSVNEGALLFIDLDQFKLINDTSGHRAGDELLMQLAALMRDKLRPNDILGRLGGDEFGVLLSGVRNVESATIAAERLRRSLEGHVFSWEQKTYYVSASIGGVMLSSVSTIKESFAQADTACYLAKEGGRNRVHFFSEDDSAVTTRITEMEWAGRLSDALREGRFLLDFQELHPIQGKAKAGAHIELLLRLRSEDGREVMPGAFLPAAERYGLMPSIDRWVVETALRNFERLHPSGAALDSCAINLSGASLEDPALFGHIAGLLRTLSLEPSRVMFEITETVAMRNFASSSALIRQLRELGCRVALDDFGAGMSSFGYMKNLTLDMVKIDGSFVQELATDRMSQSIVRAVTEIGHLQGLEVVAEWVSAPEMIALLREMGVDYGQGFALHKPERVVFQRDTHPAR